MKLEKHMLTIGIDPVLYHKLKLHCTAKQLRIGATIEQLVRDYLDLAEVRTMRESVPNEKD